MDARRRDSDRPELRGLRAWLQFDSAQWRFFHSDDGPPRRRVILWFVLVVTAVPLYLLVVAAASLGIPGTLGYNPWAEGAFLVGCAYALAWWKAGPR